MEHTFEGGEKEDSSTVSLRSSKLDIPSQGGGFCKPSVRLDHQ